MANDDMIMCTICGKEIDDLKVCSACRMVAYCSRDCHQAHYEQKPECRKRIIAKHDKILFKQPPPKEECPICMVTLPSMEGGYKHSPCCGKIICNGCIMQNLVRDGSGKKVNRVEDMVAPCPFCRKPMDEDDLNEEIMKLVELNDPKAIHSLGHWYAFGSNGFPQDMDKALEFWHKAGKLGHAQSYYDIGLAYDSGPLRDVEESEANSLLNFHRAAIMGYNPARHMLGVKEENDGNIGRAVKHFMISVRAGHYDSLDAIKILHTDGVATKDEYKAALQAYQAYLDEIKTPQRDEAAAAHEELFRYYR